MEIFIIHGYNSVKRGVHLTAGFHTVDDELGHYLIDTGHANALTTPVELVRRQDAPPIEVAMQSAIDEMESEDEPDEPDVYITASAQELMNMWDLTTDDFNGVLRITKPMVDAVVAHRIYEAEQDEDLDDSEE